MSRNNSNKLVAVQFFLSITEQIGGKRDGNCLNMEAAVVVVVRALF